MVTATHRSTLIGIFDRRDAAHNAVEALRRAGFTHHQITMVMHHPEQEKTQVTDLDAAKAAQVTGESKEIKGLAVGAVAGGLLGGALATAILVPGLGTLVVAGWLALLASVGSGVVGGAVGGGFIGALVGLDFPEAEARQYERELKAGRVLVGVKAGHRAAEAHEIIRSAGGRDLEEGEPPPYVQPAEGEEEPFTT